MAETIVTTADGTKVKVTHPEGATQEQIFRYAQQQMQERPSLLGRLVQTNEDIKRGAISGVAEGALDVTLRAPEGVGQLGDLVGRGVMWATGDPRTYEQARLDRARLVAGDATKPEELPLLGRAAYETAQAYGEASDLASMALDRLGLSYTPETTPGRYAQAMTRFATGMAFPATLSRRLGVPLSPSREAGIGALTGLTSEAGGDIAEGVGADRAWGQVAGALLTPLGAATLGTRFRRNATDVARDVLNDIPPAEIQAAIASQESARRLGTTLFPGEAVPELRQLEGDTMAQGGEGATNLRRAYMERDAASQGVADALMPDAPFPGRPALVQQLSERARQVGQRATSERTAATTGYGLAGNNPVDTAAMDQIIAQARAEAQRVGDTTARGKALLAIADAFRDSAGNPYTTIEQWHSRYQDLRNALSADLGQGQVRLLDNLDKSVAAVVEPYLSQIKDVLRRDPDFQQADDIYQRMSPEIKALFGSAELPDLAALETINDLMKLQSWPQVRQIMLGENLDPSSLRDVLARVNAEDAQYRQIDPNHQPILPQVARELLRSEIVRATRTIAGAPPANAMRGLWRTFADADTRSRLTALLRSSAEAQGMPTADVAKYIDGVEEAFRIFSQMTPSPSEMSPTAGRLQRVEDMSRAETGIGRTLQTVAEVDLGNPLRSVSRGIVGDWLRRIRTTNYAELSRILTDPRGIEILMRLPSAKRNADLQATLIEALVGVQSATQP